MSDPLPASSSQAPAKPDRTWDILCHITALAGFVIPFGNIIGPLVVWLIKKDQMPSVDAHGKEAVNFQISMTIYYIVCLILILVAIGIFLLPIIMLANLILIIVATVKASQGESYRYPATIRLIK